MQCSLFKTIVCYILDFLTQGNTALVHYGSIETSPSNVKVIITPCNFWDEEIFGTLKSIPKLPIHFLNNIPVLFGHPFITRDDSSRIILQVDIVATTFFFFSRYEEFIRKDCRDIHSRFPGKESILNKAGCLNRPIVDEYGVLLRSLLRESGAAIPPEKSGFSKIWLTHDIDLPFKFVTLTSVLKQYIKNLLRWRNGLGSSSQPLKKFLYAENDDYYTFPKIISYDNSLKQCLPDVSIQSIYFMITAGSFLNRKYYNYNLKKTRQLITYLIDSGAHIGLHISYESGSGPEKIINESKKLKKRKKTITDNSLYSRHHFLRWCEPEDITHMEHAGITDDFTLGFADCVGFRCGTSKPFKYINPATLEISKITIHPLIIMECTLDRQNYMNLSYDEALKYSKKMIDRVFTYNGELNLLWHNTEFLGNNYQEELYKAVLNYVKSKKIENIS